MTAVRAERNPETVDAYQFHRDDPRPEWLADSTMMKFSGDAVQLLANAGGLLLRANEGDWFIRYSGGALDVMTDDEFTEKFSATLVRLDS